MMLRVIDDFKKKRSMYFWKDCVWESKLYAPPHYRNRLTTKYKFKDPVAWIEHMYYWGGIQPIDFDVCGDEDIFFLFSNGEAYRLKHSWWNDYEEDGLAYEHWIEKVNFDDLPAGIKIGDRDWLT